MHRGPLLRGKTSWTFYQQRQRCCTVSSCNVAHATILSTLIKSFYVCHHESVCMCVWQREFSAFSRSHYLFVSTFLHISNVPCLHFSASIFPLLACSCLALALPPFGSVSFPSRKNVCQNSVSSKITSLQDLPHPSSFQLFHVTGLKLFCSQTLPTKKISMLFFSKILASCFSDFG